MKLKTTQMKVLHRYEPIVILGKGSFAKDLEAILLNHGFYVLSLITSSELQSYPNKNVQLVVGIFNRETAFSKLQKEAETAGFNQIFMPWEYYTRFQTDLGWRYWLSYPELIYDNYNKLVEVEDLLSDQTSKTLLESICKFRTGQDIDYSHYTDKEQQYFNNLTLQVNQTIKYYLDGGAYNGDTYNQLLNISTVEQSMLFEPDQDNFQQLTKSVSNAVCLPLALSDKTGMVSFSLGKGESSSVNGIGSTKVLAVSLDDILPNSQVDFIKLDLEGGEIPALLGAKKLIVRSRPKLAISLYHKPDDLWNIPLLLKDICKDYQFYIRQHYYNSFDSVFYGIPQ